MERLEQIISLIEHDDAAQFGIESPYRVEGVIGKIEDMITTISPSNLLKLGVGSGRILESAAQKVRNVTVVEPSVKKIAAARAKAATPYYVNGDLSLLPIDYSIFDAVLCCDYIDIFESSGAFDEISRVTNFEGYFLYCCVVLPDADLDGVYDELFRSINPLHNDYYLEGDLRTILELKNFEYVKHETMKFRRSLPEIQKYYADFLPTIGLTSGDPSAVIASGADQLKAIYNFDGENIDEYYSFSVYRRKNIE